jgi:polysaccharide biosynthesis protein PslH
LKILYLSHRVPFPPDSGAQVKPFYTIQHLRKLGHEVVLVCVDFDGVSSELISQMKAKLGETHVVRTSRWWAKLKSGLALMNPFGRSLSEAFYSSSNLKQRIAELASSKQFDFCVFYSSTMAQFVPKSLRASTIADIADIDSIKWRDYSNKHNFPISIVYATEAKRLRKLEMQIVRDFGRTCLTTNEEVQLLGIKSSNELSKLIAIPNGVDIERFKFRDKHDAIDLLPESERRKIEGIHSRVIVFTGAMDYLPNVEGVQYFVKHVLPRLQESVGPVTFLIVGSKPTETVNGLSKGKEVVVTGRVVESANYLQLANVAVVPLLTARGIQNKSLEAMACAKPLVSSVTAATGVGGVDGKNMLIASNDQEFVESIAKLLKDNDFADKLGRDAREFIESNFSWEATLDSLADELFRLKN